MNSCTCFVTDPETWFRYGDAVEQGSQLEPNPDCPVHFQKSHIITTNGHGFCVQRCAECDDLIGATDVYIVSEADWRARHVECPACPFCGDAHQHHGRCLL